MSKFDDLYIRGESREKAKLYVCGCLSEVQRKKVWQLAEKLNLFAPHPIQRLLNEAKWGEYAVQKRQRQIVYGQVGEAGVLVIDESGYVKTGTKSAGVTRPYCGRVGKVVIQHHLSGTGTHTACSSPMVLVATGTTLTSGGFTSRIGCTTTSQIRLAALTGIVEVSY